MGLFDSLFDKSKSTNTTTGTSTQTAASASQTLKQLSDAFEAKDYAKIESLKSKSIRIGASEQEQAAELYAKFEWKIQSLGTGRLLRSAFGGAPDMTPAQEETVRSVPEYLLKSGLSANAKHKGAPLIHYIIEQGNSSGDIEDAVAELINHGADANALNAKGNTAFGAHLIKGCVSDAFDFSIYLSHGAKLNNTDLATFKLFQCIMQSGLGNVLKAIPPEKLRDAVRDRANGGGKTLLQNAIVGNYVRTSDPNLIERRRREYEQKQGYVEVVQALMDQGVDPFEELAPGVTPMALAQELRREKVLRVMRGY